MNSQAQILYRDAMRFIAQRGQLRSLDALNAAFETLVAPYGVETFACAEIYSPRGMPKAGNIFGNPHEGFLQDYMRTQAFRHDPMLREALISRNAFAWSDVLARETLTPEGQAVMDLARAWSRDSGFVVPVHRPDGTIASIVMAGRNIDLSPTVRGYLQLISIYFHDLGLALAEAATQAADADRILSSLQIACLAGLAHGRSIAAIAAAENIQESEVLAEIETAQALLSVTTPARAVFTAIRRKELVL